MILAALLACVATALTAQPRGDFIVIGKKTVHYVPSARFESVTFYEKSAAGTARILAAPSKAAPLTVPAHVGQIVALPSLEEFGVVLIRLAPAAHRDLLRRALTDYNSQPGARHRTAGGWDRRDGNPIYADGSVDILAVNQIIIQVKAGVDRQTVENLVASLNGRIHRGPAEIGRDLYVVQFPGQSGQEVITLSNSLNAHKDVVLSQPDFISFDPQRLMLGGLIGVPLACLMKCADNVPAGSGGDPLLANQWQLWKINAPNAWQITQGEPTITIAILDDLIDTEHDDLKNRTYPTWNAFAADGSMVGVTLTASDFHGTAVAGLVAATTGNGLGVAGLTPKVSILPVRTHNPGAPRSVVLAGIKHAAQHADVLSMSWNYGADSPDNDLITAEIRAAVEDDRVLVFGAGNEQGQPIQYPASLAQAGPSAEDLAIITVSATNQQDALRTVANSTANCVWGTQASAETIAAPGVEVVTTDRTGTGGYCAAGSGKYAKFSGTSAATPLVAGAAALMLSKNPGMTPAQVLSQLRSTAAPLVGGGLGAGRIDVCRALQGGQACIDERAPPNPPSDLHVDP